jgi:hypothetical protein
MDSTDFTDISYSLCVVDPYIDSTCQISIDIPWLDSTCQVFIDIPWIDSTCHIYLSDYKDATTIIAISDYTDIATIIATSYYKDTSIRVCTADYVETNIFLPIPKWEDYNFFGPPIPWWEDYGTIVATADYVDGNVRIPILGISFRDTLIISKYIVTTYLDSGGVQEGFFLNIECNFGFSTYGFRIGCVTDNLAEAAHILVSTQEGHGQMSPVMLTEYGPYFGKSGTYRILHHNWIRYYQKYYGYGELNEALTAINTHRENGGELVDIVFDPPEDGWYIIRWKDVVDGQFNYTYFNNLGDTNNYIAELIRGGKYEIDSHLWESLMSYFSVFTIVASYPQANFQMSAADWENVNSITGYVWKTIVTDYDYNTGWENESGYEVPHWIRVIF